MKVSIITATYNSSQVISECLQTFNQQDYPFIEHIIVDGASKDNTLEVVNANKRKDTVIISERDKGIYDALNKGIAKATGDIIGILHSDDFFATPTAISQIVEEIKKGFDGCYSDLKYVQRDDVSKVHRHWKAGLPSQLQLELGWMPPHPTLFLRREVFQEISNYSLKYKISADYDFILRMMTSNKYKISYIPETLVCMKTGGTSNNSFGNARYKLKEEHEIASHFFGAPWITVIAKRLRKIPQLFGN
jgi:glycosyltransferase